MIEIILIIFSTVLSMIELTIIPVFLPNYQINLVLVFWTVLIYLISYRWEKGRKELNFPLSLFIAGLIFDFLSAQTFGIHALIFTLSGMILLVIRKLPFQIFAFNFLLSLILVTFLHNISLALFYFLQGKTLPDQFFIFICQSIFINVLIGILLLPLLSFGLKKIKIGKEIEL